MTDDSLAPPRTPFGRSVERTVVVQRPVKPEVVVTLESDLPGPMTVRATPSA